MNSKYGIFFIFTIFIERTILYVDPYSGMNDVVQMDESGRIVIPRKIRRRFATRTFTVRADDATIELVPIQPLASLYGKLPDLDLERIRKEHDDECRDDHFPDAD